MSAKLVLAAAVMTLVGCASGAVGTARPVAGAAAPATPIQPSNGLAAAASTYTLVAIDGHALPYARVNGKEESPARTQVVSGTLTLQANGTFAMSTKYREVEVKGDRLFDGQSSGVCAPDGDGYRMYWEGGGETTLAVSGDTVTVDNDGTLFRYLKQH